MATWHHKDESEDLDKMLAALPETPVNNKRLAVAVQWFMEFGLEPCSEVISTTGREMVLVLLNKMKRQREALKDVEYRLADKHKRKDGG